MAITPFPNLTATTFHKQLDAGRSKPSIVGCVDEADADAGQHVVKLLHSMQFGPISFLCEFVAYHLADWLTIATPSPAVSSITQEFVDALPSDLPGKTAFAKSIGLNFSTRLLTPGYGTWPTDKSIPTHLLQTCGEMFAFDVLLQNPDRRRDNPNLLWNGDEIYLFDHEMAFSFIFDAKWKDSPVDSLNARALNFFTSHVFFLELRKKKIDLSRMEGALASIQDAAILDIEQQLPKDWNSQHLGPILAYIRALRDNPTKLTRVVKEILA